MEKYEVLDVDQAIEKLKKYKGKKIVVCTVDFDKHEEGKSIFTKEEGQQLIRESKSIFYNNDDFIPNMGLYSTIQKDIDNIIPKGIVHSILFCGKLE